MRIAERKIEFIRVTLIRESLHLDLPWKIEKQKNKIGNQFVKFFFGQSQETSDHSNSLSEPHWPLSNWTMENEAPKTHILA